MLNEMRKRALRLSFPDLLTKVNSQLTSPLQFAQEFTSIQRVRNCLEHRDGMVRKQDLDDIGNMLTLSFPRLKLFYMREREEIELAEGERVDDQRGEPSVQILGRLVTRTKTYCLGDRVMFTGSEFTEIAMACCFFGQQLAASLPGLPNETPQA